MSLSNRTEKLNRENDMAVSWMAYDRRQVACGRVDAGTDDSDTPLALDARKW